MGGWPGCLLLACGGWRAGRGRGNAARGAPRGSRVGRRGGVARSASTTRASSTYSPVRTGWVGRGFGGAGGVATRSGAPTAADGVGRHRRGPRGALPTHNTGGRSSRPCAAAPGPPAPSPRAPATPADTRRTVAPHHQRCRPSRSRFPADRFVWVPRVRWFFSTVAIVGAAAAVGIAAARALSRRSVAVAAAVVVARAWARRPRLGDRGSGRVRGRAPIGTVMAGRARWRAATPARPAAHVAVPSAAAAAAAVAAAAAAAAAAVAVAVWRGADGGAGCAQGGPAVDAVAARADAGGTSSRRLPFSVRCVCALFAGQGTHVFCLGCRCSLLPFFFFFWLSPSIHVV